MKELELLCSLKEVPLDCTDPENAVTALRYGVNLSTVSVYVVNENLKCCCVFCAGRSSSMR